MEVELRKRVLSLRHVAVVAFRGGEFCGYPGPQCFSTRVTQGADSGTVLAVSYVHSHTQDHMMKMSRLSKALASLYVELKICYP